MTRSNGILISSNMKERKMGIKRIYLTIFRQYNGLEASEWSIMGKMLPDCKESVSGESEQHFEGSVGVCKTLKVFCGQRMGSRRLKDALLRKNTILCFSDSMLGVCSS